MEERSMVFTRKATSRRVIVPLLTLAMAVGSGCVRTPQEKEAKFIESGKRHMVKKDYVRAVLQFRNAVSIVPTDPEPYYQLGLAYLDAGSPREGITALSKATEQDPKHVGAQVKLAELIATSREKEYLDEAEKRMRELLKTSPQNVEVMTTLAFTESKLGKAESAEHHLRQALQQSPQNLKASVA